MLRRDVWSELGGFDEHFWPLWFEDVDFCKRARDHAYRFYYTPDAVAKHTGGHSIPKIPLEKRQLCWYRSLFGYAGIHFSARTVRGVALAVMAGSLLRMAGAVAAGRSFRPARIYWKVMLLAGRHFLSAGRHPG
jgi:GT2 family glycosyltransferase